MDVEQLRQLVSQPRESAKLDFKIAPYKLDESEEHWAELVKDVLALTNGNTGTATQNAFLIIGADDKLKPDGIPNLRDVIEKVPTSTDILRKVNKYCSPRLVNLSAEIVSLNGKRLFIISIPPSPYLHKLSQQLKTPKKEYSPHTLLVRRGDGEETYEASDEEKKALQQEKDCVLSAQAIPQDWQQVCLMMLERQKKLSTNNVIASEAMQFDLLNDKIFVSLALVERKESDRLSQDVHPARSAERYQEKTPIVYEQFREQVLQQGTIDRIAIIGDPGAGKTTLLQHIAFWTLDQHLGLPIWISLGDLIKNGDLQRLKDYLTQVWLEDAIPNVTENVRSDFLEQLNKQRVWLLLDGADEIVASSGIALREIDNQLRSWLSQSCIILTCRVNVWDADINALRYFQTYRTKEFHYPTQVEQFIENGFRKSNQPSGEHLKAELAKPERIRLQQLVRNPLRLMMLCTIWYEQESLPSTKADLSERFVSEFYKWNRNKWKKKDLNYALFPNTKARQAKLNKALGRLACCALDEEQAPFRLSHNLVFDELGDPDEEDSNFWLALSLGWLQVARNSDETSKKVYAFFHPTFQEYFAALAIDDWRFFLNHISEIPNHADSNYRSFEPQWREVIVLWFGRNDIPISLKQQAFSELSNFHDNCDGFYFFKGLFLAAECIREFQECSNHKLERVISEIIKYAFGYFNSQQQSWCIFMRPIFQEARRVTQNFLEVQKTEKRLLELVRSCPDPSVRHSIARTLNIIGVRNKEIKSILAEKVTVKHQPYMIEPAKRLIAQIKSIEDNDFSLSNEDQLDSEKSDLPKNVRLDDLMKQVQNSNDWSVVVRAVESLEKLIEGTEIIGVIKSLKPYLVNLQGYSSDEFEKKHFRYKYIYEVIWYCAQNMNYPEFYEAWHSPLPDGSEPDAVSDG